MRYLPFILALALVIYALVDCVRSDDSEMPVGLPKAVWVVLIVIFPGAGAVAWLVVSRVARQGQRTGGRPVYRGGSSAHPSAPRRPVTRQVAPDDDPEFLASLDRPRTTPGPGAQPNRETQPEPDAQPAADPPADDAADDDAQGPDGGPTPRA